MEQGGWRLDTDASGRILSLRRGTLELVPPGSGDNRPRLTGPGTLESDVDLLPLDGGGAVLRQTLTLRTTGGNTSAVRIDVPRCAHLPLENRREFYPMKDGVARREALSAGESLYEFAGANTGAVERQLAMPLISQSAASSNVRITLCSDVDFLTCFGETVHWEYAEGVPRREREVRRVYTCLHPGGEDSAIRAFHATALCEVPAGPAWLHDIAMVDYDFLSATGRGWFADIDTLEKVVAPADRGKVLLALHGWYDFCGRYSFDFRAQALDRKWLAFPNAQAPEFQKLAERPDNGNAYHWAAADIRALKPVEMTLADMHGRIQYAKSRGFRVALYFADGLNACDGIPGYDAAKVMRWGGWTGPETRGKSFCLNPVHPEVPAFFKAYLAALLEAYGREVDAFVWDETFHAQASDLGAGDYRGYAARAMMELVRDLTLMTGKHRRELAFLASDDVGLVAGYRAPYALCAHGTYQDSSCAPIGWPYGLFPNIRNTLWSCNWAPHKAFNRTRYGVEIFDVPVAISNGYAEDLGVSEMTIDQLRPILELFAARKQRRMEITWIEESGGSRTYRGRPVTGAV